MDHRRQDPASVVPGAAQGQKAETGDAGKAIKEKTKTGEYLIADDIGGGVGLTQMGILEIDPWKSYWTCRQKLTAKLIRAAGGRGA
jgi:hypothetical protein